METVRDPISTLGYNRQDDLEYMRDLKSQVSSNTRRIRELMSEYDDARERLNRLLSTSSSRRRTSTMEEYASRRASQQQNNDSSPPQRRESYTSNLTLKPSRPTNAFDMVSFVVKVDDE